MKVKFSYHAAQRMSERLNAKIDVNKDVDISRIFKKVKTYKCENKGIMVESWINPDRNNKLVLIVAKDSRVVLTVMNTGHVVDAIYYQLQAA
jgi:membrane-bound inhibitor of C-type lysozyme